jgi:hypothetical protein
MLLSNNDNGPVAAQSDRYLFPILHRLQRLSTWEVVTVLKRVELFTRSYLPNLP